MTTLNPSIAPRVLADTIAGTRVRDALLVVGGAILVGLSAQVSVLLPFTPVPFTMQTFAVLLVGAGLGWQRALPSMLLYLAAGSVGVPWFAGGSSGFGGASFGYIVGFILAAAVVGRLAEARADRKPLSTFATMVLGSGIIYAVGVPWLAVYYDVGLGRAISLGLVPFLVSDLLKAAAAGLLLPGTWWLVGRRKA
jgi:biotin transport system substrate-specific component